jgi:hypothetical protein
MQALGTVEMESLKHLVDKWLAYIYGTPIGLGGVLTSAVLVALWMHWVTMHHTVYGMLWDDLIVQRKAKNCQRVDELGQPMNLYRLAIYKGFNIDLYKEEHIKVMWSSQTN